jgi:LAO/AO transport system kinase
MQSRSVDPGTFIRSMASRGHLGGLARTTSDAVAILDAAGFDPVLIETVGVGQDEVDVIRAAGVTLVLLVPGMGDEVQAMKAGVMEIGDVFVINKAERPGADRLEADLRGLLELARRADGWEPPVVRTVASEGSGIDACVTAVAAYRKFAGAAPGNRERERARAEQRLIELVRFEAGERLARDPALRRQLGALAAAVALRELDPYTAAARLLGAAGLRPLPEGE